MSSNIMKINSRIKYTFEKKFNGDQEEDMRFISQVIDTEELHELIHKKGEYIIRTTDNQRQEIKALFYEDTKEIKTLTFQRFERKSQTPHKKRNFTFRGEEINKIYKLLRLIANIDLDGSHKRHLSDMALDQFTFEDKEKKQFIKNNPDLVKEVIEQEITKEDVVSIGYRKKQLDLFGKLLSEDGFFEHYCESNDYNGPEDVWQSFFEQNTWIFGYGLDYIFKSTLAARDLEQTVRGSTSFDEGKRVDALMKTRGFISSLCFAEIKTHSTSLLRDSSYRPGCWPVSKELAG